MWKNAIRQARLLVVDDDPECVRNLERLLDAQGFSHVVSTSDARQALPLFRRARPDAVLLDMQMPVLDGFCIMELMAQSLPPRAHLPVLAMCDPEDAGSFSSFSRASAMWDGEEGAISDARVPEWKSRALRAGADDCIVKPFDEDEVILRLNNMLRMHFEHTLLRKRAIELEESVRARTRALQEAEFEMLERLALAAEYRDDATGQHTYRVSRTAALLSHAVGLPAQQVDLIRRASPLHDIGKIGIADGILLKKHALSEAERHTMRAHTAIGAKILSGSRSPLLQMAESIALSHHEHWNGQGYPLGLQGENIPLQGRIVAVADVFDALTNERPYKGAWALDEAVEEIMRGRERQFDPGLVDAFAALPHDILLHSDSSPRLNSDAAFILDLSPPSPPLSP